MDHYPLLPELLYLSYESPPFFKGFFPFTIPWCPNDLLRYLLVGKSCHLVSLPIEAKELLGDSNVFIDQPSFFNRLAGTASLKEQLDKGWSAKEIRATWKPGLDAFMEIRRKYLLYD